MFGLTVKIEDNTRDVKRKADDAKFKNFFHAAASISKAMKESLERAPAGEASSPGSPPHTHRGVFLKRAIRFDANKEGAVIGPMASIVGDVGATHEFGETREGVKFPERPFAFPALEKSQDRFAKEWDGSIG